MSEWDSQERIDIVKVMLNRLGEAAYPLCKWLTTEELRALEQALNHFETKTRVEAKDKTLAQIVAGR